MVEKKVEQPWIEEALAIANHDINGRLHGQRRPVHPVSRQRVEDVRHRGDARFQRNVLAPPAIRVAVAVPTLVVIERN